MKNRASKYLTLIAVVVAVLGLSLGLTSTASATYYETSKLTAFKFNDLNANGQYDEGEPPLAGWEFCLLKENGDPYLRSGKQYCETTNSHGFATFSNLPVGQTFKIVETVKPGWTVTTPNPQSDTVESGSIKGEPGPNPATIGGFTITVENPSPNTWVYTLPKEASPPSNGLSHWVLGIGTCRDHVVSYSPQSGFEDFGYQSPTGYYGIKWNTSWQSGETSRSFTIVLDGNYPAGTVQATVKYGPKDTTGNILGPICYPRFGNVQGGSLTVTKAVELNGWDADSTSFNICIQGPSYPNGNESGACHAFSGGESYTWQGLQAGDYTVSETNPDAANWIVSGEGAVTVSQGQNATKTITNTRKMNDVTVTKTATTVYTRTNTYEWDIDKTVTPTQTDLFEGESTVLTYTVSVTQSLASQVDSGHRVFGDITVANPGPAKTRVASVTDVLADATCPAVTFPKELAAGESFTCSYAADLTGAIGGTNVATATLTNQSSFTGSKDYAFGEPTTTIDVNTPITVTDTQPSSLAPWTFNGSGSQTYSHQVTCNLNAFDEGNSYNIPVANTATIEQTGQSANANANVTCWVGDLEVIKAVNWGSVTPDQGKTFEICVTGPSFPQGDCKSVGYNGGSAVWENITPGAYTVVETDPGAEWTVVGNNVQVNVPTGGSAQTTITNSTDVQTGDLEVIKVVNWGSATPDQGKTFEICVTGPSFPQGDCKNVGYNGGSAVWQGIIPGAYTVVETDPGQGWTVSGSGVQVNVPAGGSAQTTITNSTDVQTGDLQVLKVVEWGNVTPDQGKTFEICVTGPSFPQGDCKNVGFDGGSAVWQGIIPGAYTVVETDPGAEWTVSGNNVQVNVPAGGSAQTTITNSTVIPASLGDFVWEDKNQNGIQDEGEPGIPNVVVTLRQPGPDGVCGTEDDSIVGTTTTDANGNYIFTDLLPGDYCVQVTPPPDFEFTIPNAGDDPTKNSKVDLLTGITPVITLDPGDNDPDQDAGLFNTNPTNLEEGDQPLGNMLYLPMLGR